MNIILLYNNYAIKEICKKDDVITSIHVKHATKETALLDIIISNEIATIVPNDIKVEEIHRTIEIDENISAPIKQNQVLGKTTFYADGLNYTVDLIASHSVDKLPYGFYLSVLVGVILLVLIGYKIVFKRSKNLK